jgi:hypothetical protein
MRDNGGPTRFKSWVSMKSWLDKPVRGSRRKFHGFRHPSNQIRGKYRPRCR